MAEARLPRLTIVVADRAHAEIYETSSQSDDLLRVKTFGNPNARLHERDLGSSAPGRSFNRSAGVHQTYQPKHTLRQQDTEKFAQLLSRNLARSIVSKRHGGVVLIADPRFLSQIRRALPRALQARIVKEIPKDLAHQPKRVIIEHLRAA